MPQPNNYMLNLPDPSQNIMNALQIGTAIQNLQAKRAAETQQLQLQTDIGALGANPTPGAIANLSAKYPQLSEHFQKTYDMLNQEQQKAHVDTASQVYAALTSGDTKVAQDILQTRIEAARNSGNEKEAKDMETMSKLIELHPETAKTSTGIFLSNAMGKDKFVDTFSKLEENRRSEALQPNAIRKAAADAGYTEAQQTKMLVDAKKAQAEISKTNADTEKVTSETALNLIKLKQQRAQGIELGQAGEKILNDSVLNSINASSLSKQYGELADSIQAEIDSSGLTGKASELVKKWTGNENNITRLRQDYKRLKNSAALKLLPPGSASDKDVEVAMEGFPSDTSNPQLIASFMRGMKKLKDFESQVESSKADWVNNVGNLGSLKADIEINGKTIKAGTSFDDFVKANMTQPNIAEGDNSVVVGGKQYTRPAGFTNEQWDAYKQAQGVK